MPIPRPSNEPPRRPAALELDPAQGRRLTARVRNGRLRNSAWAARGLLDTVPPSTSRVRRLRGGGGRRSVLPVHNGGPRKWLGYLTSWKVHRKHQNLGREAVGCAGELFFVQTFPIP